MRGQAFVAVSALAAALMAVRSSPPRRNNTRTYQDEHVANSQQCQHIQHQRTVGGAVIGGIAGAVARHTTWPTVTARAAKARRSALWSARCARRRHRRTSTALDQHAANANGQIRKRNDRIARQYSRPSGRTRPDYDRYAATAAMAM